jgi:hypothetical protein
MAPREGLKAAGTSQGMPVLNGAAIARLRAVLKPRRERYSIAVVMEQWAELARGGGPSPLGVLPDEQELISLILEPGRATRNRARKPKSRPTNAIRAIYLKGKRARAAQVRADAEAFRRKRAGRPARPRTRRVASKAGRPRADIGREALLFLGLIYREFQRAVPVLSQSTTTAFSLFAEQSFREIGQQPPKMKPAYFTRLFKTPDKRRFNRGAGRRFLWGSLSGDADPIAIMHRNIERERAERLANPGKFAERAAELKSERARRTEHLRKLADQGKI